MIDLVSLFYSLQPPEGMSEDNARFSALPIPGYERHWLAKDVQGIPSLLISIIDTNDKKRPVPIKLELLTVQCAVDCRISRSNGSFDEGQFTVVRCTGRDKALHTYFLHSIGAIVVSLGITPSRVDVAYAINNLTILFRSMSEKPRKSLQGLWAELSLIAYAHDTATIVSDRNQRIEVKSNFARIRQHHFSLEQLCPPIDTTLLIASMFVEYAGGGTSVIELTDQIRSRISNNPDLLLHVDQIISLTLAENWREALEVRFDVELAEDSLSFYEVSVIPSVSRDLPLGVKDVRFKSDLSASYPVSVQEYRSQGGLFQAALRRMTSTSSKFKRRI